ncbi:putative zinc finger protein 512b [Lasius niger]|uniref:Putative zinc finger protein 512b n=1 Tax=Lasius niger TaxID=67767 RepID=A0A0J7KJT6_LASNI|nr:putative zinc finger protein 512b [Lasius niger]
MNKLIILCALVVLAFAEERKSDEIKKTHDKEVETTKKDKRGLYGGLGYGYDGYGIGELGYGLNGLSSYSSLPIGLSPSFSTVLTKEVAVPVPQPVAVPVEKHVPVPVKVPILSLEHSLDYTFKGCENLSARQAL